MSVPNPWVQVGQALISSIRVRSNVLAPMLWLCAASVLLCLLAWAFRDVAWIRDDAVKGVFLCFLAALMWYAYFALRDPDRLQSESYLLRRQELQMIQGQEAPLVISTENTPASANPSLPPPENAGGTPGGTR